MLSKKQGIYIRTFIFALFFVVSCKKNNVIATEGKVARVYEYVLNKTEIAAHIPSGLSVKDSLLRVQNYVDHWVKDRLMYRKALQNIKEDEVLNNKVEAYKLKLYLNKYKTALVSESIDSVLLQEAIDSFYVKHKESFVLRDRLIKFKYIKLNKDYGDTRAIEKLFYSDRIEDKDSILKHYAGFTDYYFNDSTWVSLTDVYHNKRSFPELKEKELRNPFRKIKKKEEFSDYLIIVKDYKSKGEFAPLVYVENTIRQVLLHERKNNFFAQMEQVLIENAQKEDQYEIY